MSASVDVLAFSKCGAFRCVPVVPGVKQGQTCNVQLEKTRGLHLKLDTPKLACYMLKFITVKLEQDWKRLPLVEPSFICIIRFSLEYFFTVACVFAFTCTVLIFLHCLSNMWKVLHLSVFQELEQYKRNAAKSWKGLELETWDIFCFITHIQHVIMYIGYIYILFVYFCIIFYVVLFYNYINKCWHFNQEKYSFSLPIIMFVLPNKTNKFMFFFFLAISGSRIKVTTRKLYMP